MTPQTPRRTRQPDHRGLHFIRALRTLANGANNPANAAESTPRNDPLVRAFLEKELQGAINTTSVLTNTQGDPIAREFGQYLFEQTLPGQIMAAGGIPIDFNTRLDGLTASGAAWIQEGRGFPVTKASVTSETLHDYKIGAITVVSNDLLRQASTGSDLAIRNALITDSVRQIDSKFASDDATQTNTAPGGILENVTATGLALEPMIQAHMANNNNPLTSVLVLSYNDSWLTEAELQNLAIMGIWPVYSQYATKRFIIDAAKVAVAFRGGVIDTTQTGTIEMQTQPSQDSVTPVSTDTISLFQDNATAYRVVTYIDWAVMDNGVTSV